MAKVQELMSCQSFANAFVSNEREKFYLNKKYGDKLFSKEEWIEICKRDSINITK